MHVLCITKFKRIPMLSRLARIRKGYTRNSCLTPSLPHVHFKHNWSAHALYSWRLEFQHSSRVSVIFPKQHITGYHYQALIPVLPACPVSFVSPSFRVIMLQNFSVTLSSSSVHFNGII